MIGNLLCILLGAVLHWGIQKYRWDRDFKTYVRSLRERAEEEIRAGGTSSDDE